MPGEIPQPPPEELIDRVPSELRGGQEERARTERAGETADKMIEIPDWVLEGIPRTTMPETTAGPVRKGGRFNSGTVPVKNPGPQAIRQAQQMGFDVFKDEAGVVRAKRPDEPYPPEK
jgi:hypothetical protein